MKILQISSASSSHSVENYEEDIYRAWNSKVAYQIKKFYPSLDVESWTIERKYKKNETKFNDGLKFRIFPTVFSKRHGIEISTKILRALKEEQKKAIKNNEKLIIHLHEHHTWQSYLILLFAKKKKNIKIISSHHGGRNPLENLKKYKKLAGLLPGILLMQLFERLFFKKIDLFYSETKDETNYLKRVAPKSQILFQSMGIEEEYFENEKKDSARKKLGLKKEKKYLLFLGRVKTTKGMRELLSAMKNIKEKNIELLIVGGGADYEFYKDFAEKNKIENTKFLGPIYGDKKLSYLSACDCLILPSYTESCPVSLMEAIARNLPVIATDVGGIPLMIEDGREGIIIKPKSDQDIIKAIAGILKWERKEIKQYADRYRWKNIIENTIKDYGR